VVRAKRDFGNALALPFRWPRSIYDNIRLDLQRSRKRHARRTRAPRIHLLIPSLSYSEEVATTNPNREFGTLSPWRLHKLPDRRSEFGPVILLCRCFDKTGSNSAKRRRSGSAPTSEPKLDSELAGSEQSHRTFENLSLTDCGISSSKRRESHSCSLGVWCEARNCNPIRCSLAQQTVDSSVN